mgnify:CR=1 FL=1
MSMTAITGTAAQDNASDALLPIGDKVFVMTASLYWLGRIVRVWEESGATFFSLEEASWVSETSPPASFFTKGVDDPKLVSPFVGNIKLNLAGVMAIFAWPHKLPR